MDRPRRAMLEEPDREPDGPVPYVARRSGGFAPAEPDDDLEPEDEDDEPAPRPRRALLAVPDSEPPASVAPTAVPPSRPVESAEEWRRRAASFFAPPTPPKPDPEPEAEFEPEPAVEPEPEPESELAPVPPPEPVSRPDTPSFVASRPAAPAVTSTTREPDPSAPDVQRVEPIIVDRLVKSYNGKLAVRNLSFTVQPGRVTGFLGPNGAGKTTTMRILVGLINATTGTARFGSTAYADLARPQRSVGCVLDANFHPGRTGRNHLRILAPTAGASDSRVDSLLDLVGLGDVARQPAGEYSLGMRQRLALAGALLGDPEYLILDEPANGLDPEGIRWLRSLLRDFAHAGRAVLVSSHLLNEVQATADDIVVINKGRLLTQMPIAELNLGEGTTRARVADLDAARRALSTIAADVEIGHDDQGQYLRVHSNEVAAVGAALFGAGVVVFELVTERRDLEQEFFAMLEEST